MKKAMLPWTRDAAISGLDDWVGQNIFADNPVFAGFDDFPRKPLRAIANSHHQQEKDRGPS